VKCVYLGEPTDDGAVFQCQVHDRCCPASNRRKVKGCEGCKERLSIGDEGFADRWIDPLKVVDKRGKPTGSLRDLLGGRSVFLMGGGPSANDLPLEELGRRGCWTLAVNNAAGHARIRPQAMLCSDPPNKFSHSVWLDPGITKFVPAVKLKGNHKTRTWLRRKLPDGSFEWIDDLRTRDCPNVWGFRRESWFKPDDSFFTSEGALWGNHDAGMKRTGEEKTVCTMLLALRLLRHLGARRVFLLGVDFRMGEGYGYSFEQERKPGACESNNNQFRVVNDWLVRLQRGGTFERFGIEFFNCFARSGLRAFPHVPFEDALRLATEGIERTPSLAGWYDK
jgi:hypothetical protein